MAQRWAVVTGGGSGIGALIVEALAARGLQVLCCGRRELPDRTGLATEVAPRWKRDVKAVQYLRADIGTAEGREELVSALPSKAALAVLVQNAAVGEPFPFGSIPLDHWRYAMEVNVTAPLFLTQAFLPALRRGHGRILHLGTGVAHNPQRGTAVYGVTKSAFHRLFRQLNAELSDEIVVAGSVSPGVVDTAGVREHVEAARKHSLPHVQYFDQVYSNQDLSDPAALASFCASLLLDVPSPMLAEQEWSFKNSEHRELVAAAVAKSVKESDIFNANTNDDDVKDTDRGNSDGTKARL